jgi:hypothetical protein
MGMSRTSNNGRGVDVRGPELLGTLATHAPLPSEFQFVKFRVDGEVAHLRLDRPEQNLLNERMLMEIAAGINSVSEKASVKWIPRARRFQAESSWANTRNGAYFSCWTHSTMRSPQ